MRYFNSEFHEVKIKVDLENSQAFVKGYDSDTETPIESNTKVFTDTIIANEEITEEQYNEKGSI